MSHSNFKSSRDNRANSLNPTQPVYYRSLGVFAEDAHVKAEQSQPNLNNHRNSPHHGRYGNGGAR